MTSNSRVGAIGIVMSLLIGSHPVWAQQDPSGAEEPGSTYASLQPAQTRLVDDWFMRLSAVVEKAVNPAEGYENLPLSARTTTEWTPSQARFWAPGAITNSGSTSR